MRTLLNKIALWASFGLVILALVVTPASLPARAADHLDAPFTKTDGRIDINDVYVFHPGETGSQDLDTTVLVMTINPAAGVISGDEFRQDARYDFLIDTNADARPDLVFRAEFGAVRTDGSQNVRVIMRQDGMNTLVASGKTETTLTGTDGARVFAGLRDDPFFFDLNSFNDGATFCETGDSDFFLGLNVSAIVLEVPTAWIGAAPVGVWGRTLLSTGQADRMGRPAILTVFIPPNPFEASPELEDAYNLGDPKDDQANFRGEVVNSLTLLFSLNDASGDDPSDDAAQIEGLADILLPDILTVDLSLETGFLNGRNLADDVIDAELGLITEGLITSDCIANDSTFLSDMPYLGVPNP